MDQFIFMRILRIILMMTHSYKRMIVVVLLNLYIRDWSLEPMTAGCRMNVFKTFSIALVSNLYICLKYYVLQDEERQRQM